MDKLLIDEAEKEARQLRELITPEEQSRLILRHFNPKTIQNCIYGQLTGNCYSERAVELLTACAKAAGIKIDGEQTHRWLEISQENAFKVDNETRNFFSALECYITSEYAKIDHLYMFLRGEIDSLNLIPEANQK